MTIKYFKNTALLSLFLGLIFSISAFAQVQKFTNPNVEYSFDVPDEKWKMTVKPSATDANVEYVYGERNQGHLEVRKLSVPANAVLSNVIREEEQKLQFLPGFVAGKDENFNGSLKGSVFNYEFVKAGRPMSGRFYFLKVNPTTLYVVRFTGFTDKLRSLRNQTDSVARTFSVK